MFSPARTFWNCWETPLPALLAGISLALAVAQNVSAQTHATNSAAELSLKKLQAAPGLKVELFAAEPLLENPVSFSIDARGRFFIAETHRWDISIFDITKDLPWLLNDLSFRTVEQRTEFLARQFATNLTLLTRDSELIRLVEDRAGTGRADTSNVFADGFNAIPSGVAAGILAHHGEVWFTCIPDLWRVKSLETSPAAPASPNSKPQPRKEKLISGLGVHIGVSGHDAHGVIPGPDGRLYFSVGDRGFAPPDDIRGFGFTRAFLKRTLPDTGAVFRCHPDGSEFEVFCLGLRNPQELAFDNFGNLFTVDNDTAGPDDSRLLHLVEGGDYGWRCSYQHMKNFGPWCEENLWRGGIDDVLPPAGMVAQGPAGFAFYPGTGLPASYQGKFLICDFPGGVWSFSVKPRGASFEVAGREKFLWNCLPTDVAFGPDGAVYVSDWVEGWGQTHKGRLYRISDPAQAGSALRAEVKRLLAEGMEKRSATELGKLLGHQDQRVRLESQWELVKRRAVKNLENAARQTNSALARLHGLWGLDQLNAGELRGLGHLTGDQDEQIRSLICAVLGKQESAASEALLITSLSDRSSRVQAAAAIGLARRRALADRPAAATALLHCLEENADRDPFLTHAGVLMLVNIGDPNLIQRAAINPSPAVRHAALLAMRRLEMPEIVRFLNDPEPRLKYEAARAINDIPIEAALPELALFVGKVDCPTNLMSRAINACFRLGTERHAKMLGGFANRADVPETFRARALDALGNWRVEQATPGHVPVSPERDPRHGATPTVNPENWPGWFDGVVGLWRPLPPRHEQAAKRAFLAVGSTLMVGKSERVQLAVIHTAVKLKAKEATHGLFEKFRDTNTTAVVRREIPAALAALNYAQTGEAVALALADQDVTVRQAGVALLDRVTVPDTATVLANLLATEANVRFAQTAFATLGRLQDAKSDEVLAHWLEKMRAGQLRVELHLDVLQAAAGHTNRHLVESLNQYQAGLAKGDPMALFRPMLAGGDAAVGKTIFHEHPVAACLRCHAIGGAGGTVGPDLAGVAMRQKREYLLESMLFPNKQIAAEFETTIVTLKSGANHAGIVKNETESELVLHSPEDGLLKLKKSEIQKRQRGLSAMPEGLDKLLTPQELRDLVEYLASLK